MKIRARKCRLKNCKNRIKRHDEYANTQIFYVHLG